MLPVRPRRCHRIQYFRDDTDLALEIYELAIEFHERRPSRFLSDTYTNYAQLLERMGKLDQAFAAYKRAATLQTELARA
jgi:tetratricopeptide (TPR) repeat protein